MSLFIYLQCLLFHIFHFHGLKNNLRMLIVSMLHKKHIFIIIRKWITPMFVLLSIVNKLTIFILAFSQYWMTQYKLLFPYLKKYEA